MLKKLNRVNNVTKKRILGALSNLMCLEMSVLPFYDVK